MRSSSWPVTPRRFAQRLHAYLRSVAVPRGERLDCLCLFSDSRYPIVSLEGVSLVWQGIL